MTRITADVIAANQPANGKSGSMRAAGELRAAGLRRNDLEIGEVSTRHVADPQPDQSFLAVAQLIDDEAGLCRAVDVDAHLRARNGYPRAEPSVGIGYGTHRLLVFS